MKSKKSQIGDGDPRPKTKPEAATKFYNPAAHNNKAAKVWELLRRNPFFRARAKALVEKNGASPNINALAEEFKSTDEKNPIAGYVVRWLFKPNPIKFNYPPPQDIGGGKFRTNEQIQKGLSWSKLEVASQKLWRTGKQRERSLVYSWDYDDEEGLERLESMICEEKEGYSYAGPLAVSEGRFTLETPWPKTPELFRFFFNWLWLAYDIASPFDDWTNADAFTRGEFNPGHINWSFLEHGNSALEPETVNELRRLEFLLENHDIFALPRMIGQQRHEDALKRRFARLLKARSHRKRLDVNPSTPSKSVLKDTRLLVDTEKYKHFLGATKDWEIFTAVYPKSEYLGDAASNLTAYGAQKTLKELVGKANDSAAYSENSHLDGHFKGRWVKMDKLMKLIYPLFDFVTILEKELKLNPSDVINNAAQFKLRDCKERLQLLCGYSDMSG